MEKKKIGILSGGVLVIALVAMIGIVYAAYSQTLNINGDATVKANSWKIKFANLSAAKLKGEATEVTAPTINNNDTNIGDYSVLLSKPGDSVEYTFDIVNEGTFDAESTMLFMNPTPTCTGTGANAEEDAAKVCKHLTYEYSLPGAAMISGQITDGKINLAQGTKLESMGIKLTYSADVPAEDLPTNDVAISGLNAYITFVQK